MPERLSIVHVVNTKNFAGVERHVVTLANQQAAVGSKVGVIGGRTDVMRAELSPDVSHMSYRNALNSTSQIRKAGADIVHAHMTSAETAALFAPRGNGLITTRHFAARRGRSLPGRAISPMIRHRFRTQVAVSRFVQESIDGDSVVIHNSVEQAPLGGSRETRTILVAQRLAAEKATGLAIRIFAESGLAMTGWRLVIAGSGPCRHAIREQAQTVPGVSLIGFRSDLLRLMDEVSVFLAPAPAEPFGLSVVEAMARGIPVVASDAGGHRETVGLAGRAFLFPRDDARTGGALLRHLASDPAQATRYGHELREVQRAYFTPQLQVKRTLQVYLDVLNA